jgi:hypothetical protein
MGLHTHRKISNHQKHKSRVRKIAIESVSSPLMNKNLQLTHSRCTAQNMQIIFSSTSLRTLNVNKSGTGHWPRGWMDKYVYKVLTAGLGALRSLLNSIKRALKAPRAANTKVGRRRRRCRAPPRTGKGAGGGTRSPGSRDTPVHWLRRRADAFRPRAPRKSQYLQWKIIGNGGAAGERKRFCPNYMYIFALLWIYMRSSCRGMRKTLAAAAD